MKDLAAALAGSKLPAVGGDIALVAAAGAGPRLRSRVGDMRRLVDRCGQNQRHALCGRRLQRLASKDAGVRDKSRSLRRFRQGRRTKRVQAAFPRRRYE